MRDDATREAPSEESCSTRASRINQAGVKNENITIIFGTGIHRPVTDEEAEMLLGEEVLKRVKVISHDAKAPDLVHVGTTKRGNKVKLNRVFAEANVRVLLGDVGFHYYAGYGGGRKSILPAVAGEDSIKFNHAMLLNPNARIGILEGNPVHEDMVEAAKLVKVDFVVNVVTNSKSQIVQAFAGELDEVFNHGVKLVDEMYPSDRGAADLI